MRSALVLLGLVACLAPAASAKSAFDVGLAMDEKWEKPQAAVDFPATFTSRAGGDLLLRFDVIEATGGLNVPVPRPVHLAAGEARTVPLVVHTPFRNGHMNEEGVVTYRASAEWSDGSPAGAPQEFSVTVHTKGFYVPGPGMGLVFAALAALLLARRR